MHLPVAPFITVCVIVVVDDKSFTIGLFFLAEEEIKLVQTIDNAIIRDFVTSNISESRQKINNVNNLVAYTICWNPIRPANQERGAK